LELELVLVELVKAKGPAESALALALECPGNQRYHCRSASNRCCTHLLKYLLDSRHKWSYLRKRSNNIWDQRMRV
jgi:hypothetical protein